MSIHFLDQKLEGDISLWRYMKLSTLMLLLDGKAFFPSITTLKKQDPFEGELHCDAEWLMTALRHVENPNQTLPTHDWLFQQCTPQEQNNQLLNKDNPQYNTTFFKNCYIREINKRRSAWCWFEGHFESYLMWSTYGDRGIAVKTSLRKLQESLPSDDFFQIGKIYYVDSTNSSPKSYHPESVQGKARLLYPYFVKSIEYEHEKEWRILTDCYPSDEGQMIEGIDFRNLIQEIRISPLIPHAEAKIIEAYVRENFSESSMMVGRSNLLGNRIAIDEVADGIGKIFRKAVGISKEMDLPEIMMIRNRLNPSA